MADTENITLYPYYELVQIKTTPRKHGTRVISDRVDHVPIAIFTERTELERYAAAAGLIAGQTYWTREEKTELEPKAENFSLPFNPEAPVTQPVEAASDEQGDESKSE